MLTTSSSSNLIQSNKIFLTYLNGTGYIFNVDDYMTLRTKHRIIGSFVGASTAKGWNPNENGLPAELSKYETKLLVEKGFAVLLRKAISLRNNPKEETVQEFNNFIEKRISQQADCLKARKLEGPAKRVNDIIAGKKKKLLAEGTPEEDINITPEDVLKEIENNIVFNRNDALLDIPCEHPFKHDSLPVECYTIEEELTPKYLVFRDLWEKGKYVTSGEAFGADFLAYPGDPLLFHASHIIIILNNRNILPLDLITKCRLSVTVNKICMLAYFNENNEICYQCVEWEKCKDDIISGNIASTSGSTSSQQNL